MNKVNDKWLVIVNPMASVGKSGKDWPVIKQLLIDEGIDFDFVLTEHPQHAIEITREGIVNKGFRKFISVGGDGTNNEIVNGIFTQNQVPTDEITLGIIPIGTGNDWSRSFGFPFDYKKVVKIIKNGRTFTHDVGIVTYYNDNNSQCRYFLNAAGTGLDETVCTATNEKKKAGKGGSFRYFTSLVGCFFKYNCPHIQMEIDGRQVYDGRILSLSIGNCQYIGGGMKMMPNALANDGELDVTVIQKVSLLKLALNIKNIYNGTFIRTMKEQVFTYRGKQIHIVSIPAHSIKVETEGESLNNSPFDFGIIPHAIQMVINPAMLDSISKDSRPAKK